MPRVGDIKEITRSCYHFLTFPLTFHFFIIEWWIMCSAHVILCTETRLYSSVNFVLYRWNPFGLCIDIKYVYSAADESVLHLF